MSAATEQTLEMVGLAVTEHSLSSGETVYKVSGDTYPHRHVLREVGGRWSSMDEVWVFSGSDPSDAVAEKVQAKRQAQGLSDAMPTNPVLSNKPHYLGHRGRLRDRFLSGPAESIPDYELLELLLFFSIDQRDTKPLAKELLGRFESPAGVLNADPEQLEEFEHINKRTLALFKAVRVMGARLVKEELSDRAVLDSWDKLIDYLRASMAHLMVEQFRVLFLDRMNVLIKDEVQHEGTIDHTSAYPREVVKRALQVDASAVVMVHNHPSNHPKPSKPDIAMTRDVRDALDKVGIMLHDHLIISKRGHTSFRQMNLL
jgi:DNA repair protein RadC